MPIYEYVCTNCGHEMEALQKMSDAPIRICPQCREEALRKKVSAPSFRLKGGGWYETDFKSGNKKNVLTAEKASDSGNDTKDKNEKKSSSSSGNSSESKNSSSSSVNNAHSKS